MWGCKFTQQTHANEVFKSEFVTEHNTNYSWHFTESKKKKMFTSSDSSSHGNDLFLPLNVWPLNSDLNLMPWSFQPKVRVTHVRVTTVSSLSPRVPTHCGENQDSQVESLLRQSQVWSDCVDITQFPRSAPLKVSGHEKFTFIFTTCLFGFYGEGWNWKLCWLSGFFLLTHAAVLLYIIIDDIILGSRFYCFWTGPLSCVSGGGVGLPPVRRSVVRSPAPAEVSLDGLWWLLHQHIVSTVCVWRAV